MIAALVVLTVLAGVSVVAAVVAAFAAIDAADHQAAAIQAAYAAREKHILKLHEEHAAERERLITALIDQPGFSRLQHAEVQAGLLGQKAVVERDLMDEMERRRQADRFEPIGTAR